MKSQRETLLEEFIEELMVCVPAGDRHWHTEGQYTIWLTNDEIERLHEWAKDHGFKPRGGINPTDRKRIAQSAAS